ncbi:hypothetical protein N9043_00815 [bacterium]|nr:hypothetical protein [bacterium]
MKVLYNARFGGGFTLSNLATHLYAKKKGIDLTWYIENNDRTYSRVDGVPSGNSYSSYSSIHPSTIDMGVLLGKFEDNNLYYLGRCEDIRSDPDLVDVVEQLGDCASGWSSYIQVEEIPDDAEYEISEYNGIEEILPPRMSWQLSSKIIQQSGGASYMNKDLKDNNSMEECDIEEAHELMRSALLLGEDKPRTFSYYADCIVDIVDRSAILQGFIENSNLRLKE